MPTIHWHTPNMSGKRHPKDPWANKAASLQNCFPGLKVPEAMLAAQFSNQESQQPTLQMQVHQLSKKKIEASTSSSEHPPTLIEKKMITASFSWPIWLPSSTSRRWQPQLLVLIQESLLKRDTIAMSKYSADATTTGGGHIKHDYSFYCTVISVHEKDQPFGKRETTLGSNVKMFRRCYRNIEAK